MINKKTTETYIKETLYTKETKTIRIEEIEEEKRGEEKENVNCHVELQKNEYGVYER